MKRILLLITLAFSCHFVFAQNKEVDSVMQLLNKASTDSDRIQQLIEIGHLLDLSLAKGDSAQHYLQEALELSVKTGDIKSAAIAQFYMAYNLVHSANYPRALILSQENLKKLEELKKEKNISITFGNNRDLLFYQTRLLVNIYSNIGDYKKQLDYVKRMQSIYYASLNSGAEAKNYAFTIYFNLANVYDKLKMADSSYHYRLLLYQATEATPDAQWMALASSTLAGYYYDQNILDSAMLLFRQCIPMAIKSGRSDLLVTSELHIGSIFQKKQQRDSAFYYTRQALQRLSSLNNPNNLLEAYNQLSKLYRDNKQFDSAYKYQSNYIALKDSLQDQTKLSDAQNFVLNQTLQDQQLEQAKKEARQQAENRIKLYALAAIIAFVLLAAILLMRNLRNKRAANIVLTQQKEEVQNSLVALKAAQSQLIQSEKMASLGELTAGIAHEIQNPLNFVNNFSEVNNELIEELKSQKSKLKSEEQDELLNDIFQNNEKINHHGKRADAIVKGMLQHSQSGIGKKEPTDINALVDEYLRLAYATVIAKDKNFTVEIKKSLDATIGNIHIIPQDIGKVLLNVFNNAFYAVAEKFKSCQGGLIDTVLHYEPIVSISTKKEGDKIMIRVCDNGNGIPPTISDKIFQPFFTTKPTGQGTGLGLSLSYDLMKAHQGSIRLQPTDQSNDVTAATTIFILELPAK